jgi:hypothetical protein
VRRRDRFGQFDGSFAARSSGSVETGAGPAGRQAASEFIPVLEEMTEEAIS